MSNRENDFNERARVQVPSLVHLLRLGYQYVGKPSELNYDKSDNILIDVFKKQFIRLNNRKNEKDADDELRNISRMLYNDDLGREFYNHLLDPSITLIDFDKAERNIFQFTFEFTCENEGDSFRPDITLFINGLPLVFIETKVPGKKNSIIEESERMNKVRLNNRNFRRFMNITELMIFSNNSEYMKDESSTIPIQGAFYSTPNRKKAFFNLFREENSKYLNISPFIENYPYLEIDKNVEKRILRDFNSEILYETVEYKTNLNINSPTNRILTSLVSKERLLFILKYGISYVVGTELKENGDTSYKKYYKRLFILLFTNINKVDKLLSGSVQKQLTRENLKLMYILCPNKRILENFERIANKIRSECKNLSYESSSLFSFRNFLLPLLMNGQAKVE